MAFRNKTNEHDQWQDYCSNRRRCLDAIPRLKPLFNAADHIDTFLQTGSFSFKDVEYKIESLTEREWDALVLFVDDYSDTWQSYFTRTQYIAYFSELDRRETQIGQPNDN